MTTADSLIKVQEPVFYHREYASDFSSKASDPFYTGWQHYAKRIAVIALPFLTLNKTLSFPVTLVMGGLRTVTSASDLYELAMQDQHPSKRQIALKAINTCVAVIALGGTIFAHPVGMLITTGHDLIGQIYIFANQLAFSYFIDFENVANIFSNLVYLALFLHGGVELAIVALLLQTLVCCYKAYAELDEASEEEPERYLEAIAHFAMAVVRANQTAGQIQILQPQWQLEALTDEASPKENFKLVKWLQEHYKKN